MAAVFANLTVIRQGKKRDRDQRCPPILGKII